ncbi:MAG: hypothetical protein BWX68_03001 [Verrucomicrobia bacterium ADurb.Bin063]|nr:MAG: hypothetical protein BWX68_03001 [Verrucomicrobia bacterium ADurb.Bin063]
MSSAHAVLGTPIAPRAGLARSKTRKAAVGLHLPSAKEIRRAADSWQRRQSLRAGSGYFSTPPLASMNLNRKFA